MFTLAVDGCDDELRVVRFAGQEAISSLFEFRVEVAGGELTVHTLVGCSAVLTIDGLYGARTVHGLVCQVEYIGSSSSYALYELILVPQIWVLQQRATCRIFQQKTTPQILAAVLDDAGLKSYYRIDLNAAYTPRDYCTQYGETDLDFIHRLMEADGIIYFFDDTPGHMLVLTDRSGCGRPASGEVELAWCPEQGVVHDAEHVTYLRLGELMRPERVSLRDRNLHTPGTRLEDSEGAGTTRELYEYPGGYQKAGKGAPDRGGQQARLRLEALQATRIRGSGTSDSPRLVAGFAFTLEGHPRSGIDGEYRVVSVSHQGEQPQVLDEDVDDEFRYSNDFECMESKVPYRAPRITPRPAVRGPQTATIVGPPGEEVHVDEHGRVKVQFHWDRRDALDETSSCWVRVSQLWAGNGFGAMFLPRIGHEVVVDFLEGDPDRPLITGRIYTGYNSPPYALPDEKTKSTIKSDSSPGGGGSNELRFEDAKGSEEVYIHGQRDLKISVENDSTSTIGHDESLTIGRDRSTLVKHDEREEIANNRTIKVGNVHTEEIGAGMKLTVGADLNETVRGGQQLTVTKDITTKAGGQFDVAADANINISSARSTVVVGGDKLTLRCGAASITIQSSGAVSIQTQGPVTVRGSKIDLN